jgi:regulator of cell morphogenesis and NO signaling
MITERDKLSDVISMNIDLLPITHRLGLSTHIGEKTIREICILCGRDVKFTLGILNTFSTANYLPNPEDMDLCPLIDFLTKTHEFHKQVTIPRLSGLIVQMKQLMPNEKLLIVVEDYLNQYIEKLIKHIDYEETEVFPLVRKRVEVKVKTHVSNLKKLFKQHTNVENELSDLKTIIIRHIPQDVDMNLINDLLHTLSHFEKEQVDHARFEDKILIPRLIALQTP